MQSEERRRLSPQERHRFEVAGVAEAWLAKPLGYPRELRAVVPALEDDERVSSVFEVFHSKWFGGGGLLFLTDRRIVFVHTPLWMRRILSIPFTQIDDLSMRSIGYREDLIVHTDGGKAYTFWQGGSDRNVLERLRSALEEKIGTTSGARRASERGR